MKNYIKPELDLVELNTSDIITASPGTETPKHEEDGGIWDLTIG